MNFFKTILQTITGLNNEGSAKRISSLYFSVILLTSVLYVFEKAFTVSANALVPTPAQMIVIKMCIPIVYSLETTILIMLGLATVETITSLIKTIKGSEPIKKSDPDA